MKMVMIHDAEEPDPINKAVIEHRANLAKSIKPSYTTQLIRNLNPPGTVFRTPMNQDVIPDPPRVPTVKIETGISGYMSMIPEINDNNL